ncbi:MAG: hypothetical protein PHU21_07975 [Elusimicrobia bacterium]|nr:hypothetical protein [Elusimicrobiota bacterium]
MTTRLLVLYGSMYGKQAAEANALVAAMADAAAEGARSVEGVEVVVKRVADPLEEDAPDRTAAAPAVSFAELQGFDAVILGIPTRYGNMAVQIQDFLRQMSGHGRQGEVVGRLVSVFTNSGGWGDPAILPLFPMLLSRGLLVVGWPYSSTADPGSASTQAGAEARAHGRQVAEVAQRLRR